MGKIIETGLKIVCDRCDKPKDVVDEKQVNFYKDFSKKKDRDDTMFAFVLNGFDGPKNVSFEYLCPECLSAIAGYVGKCEKPKGRGAKEEEKKDPPLAEKTEEPKAEEKKEEPKAAAPKAEEKKEAPPKTEEKKPEPEKKSDPATDDDDIFDS